MMLYHCTDSRRTILSIWYPFSLIFNCASNKLFLLRSCFKYAEISSILSKSETNTFKRLFSVCEISSHIFNLGTYPNIAQYNFFMTEGEVIKYFVVHTSSSLSD